MNNFFTPDIIFCLLHFEYIFLCLYFEDEERGNCLINVFHIFCLIFIRLAIF